MRKHLIAFNPSTNRFLYIMEVTDGYTIGDDAKNDGLMIISHDDLKKIDRDAIVMPDSVRRSL